MSDKYPMEWKFQGVRGLKEKCPPWGVGVWIIPGTTDCMEGEFEQIIRKILLSIKDNNY